MKLLHIDSSIQAGASASRTISATIVERLRAADPTLQVLYRDLVTLPLAHMTMETLAVDQPNEILAEFLDADIVVIGAGLYNFTIPTQLKAWIDRILVAGQTFKYGEAGPVGLVKGKRVFVALARGASYAGDSPLASWEHAETLLRLTLTFIGITDAEFVIAEGLALGEDARRVGIAAALEQARNINAPASPVHA